LTKFGTQKTVLTDTAKQLYYRRKGKKTPYREAGIFHAVVSGSESEIFDLFPSCASW